LLLPFVLLVALILAIGASAGPVGTAAGFEDDDGNLVDDAAAGIDWNSFDPISYSIGTAPFRQATKTDLGWQLLALEDAQAVTDDSGFAGGTKQDDDCASVISAKAPNKDDLKRAYVASSTGANGHVFLMLAWVRIPQNSTSASAHIGFEFNKATSGACPAASDGLVKRSAGDVLIVYDFEGGSNPPVITLRRWVLSGACDVSSNSAPCWGPAATLAAGTAEAAVNFASTAVDALAPPTPPATTSVDETLGLVEFGEAGIDLTNAEVFTPGACNSFGKVYAVSRSSGSSGTAQMKDLVGPGNFTIANCSATLTTSPSPGAGGAVTPGTQVTDTAVAQGVNVAGTPPTPTGNVTFFLCGPTATESTDLCTTGGTQVGTAKALADSSPPPGEASAVSDAVNTAQNPLLPGRYCFRAEWPGDSNYAGPFSDAGTGNSECFIVAKLVSTTATTSSPTGGDVAPGTSVTDTATVSGSGPTPTGTVDFFLCQPSEVTAAGCPTGSGTKIGDTKTLSNGSATSDATTNTTAIGKYCWRAEYSGDGIYLASSHTDDTTECFTTTRRASTTATTSNPTGAVAVGASVTDTATVSGSGPTPTGTVDFFLCQPSEVTPGGCEGTAGTKIGATKTLSDGSATSDATTNTNTVGKYCWRAEYSGNGFYLPSSHTDDTTECFTVGDTTTSSSNQSWVPNDTGTVAATGGTPLNGTLTITLHESSDCTGDAVAGQTYTKTLTNATTAADRTLTTTNSTYIVTGNGSHTVSWKIVFTPTGSFVTGSTHCETSTVTITD
jgi:hypothetical protein